MKSALRAVRYSDLLSVPYLRGGRNLGVGIDCLFQMVEIHRRLGLFHPNGAIDETRAQHDWVLDSNWTALRVDVASVCELGDVLVLPGNPLGVATLVDKSGQLVLTTTPEGGARAMRADALVRAAGGLVGVYRWCAQTPSAKLKT